MGDGVEIMGSRGRIDYIGKSQDEERRMTITAFSNPDFDGNAAFNSYIQT
jgi:hypothetical protein